MSNILIDALPVAVEIDGQDVPINSGFRDCLRVILAFEDADLSPTEQVMILLDNLYPEPPPNLPAAVRQGVKFLNGGEVTDSDGGGDNLRLYGFDHDAALIFAAFRQTHGIDLESAKGLHWWKFLALFMDLGSETTFCQLVGLRKRVRTGKASKEELRLYRELGEVAEPDTSTPEERARQEEFMRIVMEAEERRREERKQKASR